MNIGYSPQTLLKRLLSGIFIVTACSLLTFSSASAQGVPVSANGVQLSVSTNNPVPGQTITVTAKSYSIDINSAKVTWAVDGIVKQSGIGASTLDIVAPALGKKLSVSVSATTPGGSSLTATIGIGSGAVDMITESDGYVPPFFAGKIPVAYQNSIKIVAIPHLADISGKEFDPKTLVYQWKKNDQALPDQSGYGKQYLTITGDMIPRPYNIFVTVSDRNNTAQALGVISVTPQKPSVSFYVDDPLYGPLFNNEISDTVGIGSQRETSVLMVPYGFDTTSDISKSLTLTWLINGTEHPELASSKSVTLRAPDNSAGSSNVSVDIKSVDNILQGATGSFHATFSSTKQTATGKSVTF